MWGSNQPRHSKGPRPSRGRPDLAENIRKITGWAYENKTGKPVACLDSQCHRVPTVGLLPMLDQAAECGCGWGMSHKDMLKQAHAVHGSGCDESGWGETGR